MLDKGLCNDCCLNHSTQEIAAAAYHVLQETHNRVQDRTGQNGAWSVSRMEHFWSISGPGARGNGWPWACPHNDINHAFPNTHTAAVSVPCRATLLLLLASKPECCCNNWRWCCVLPCERDGTAGQHRQEAHSFCVSLLASGVCGSSWCLLAQRRQCMQQLPYLAQPTQPPPVVICHSSQVF